MRILLFPLFCSSLFLLSQETFAAPCSAAQRIINAEVIGGSVLDFEVNVMPKNCNNGCSGRIVYELRFDYMKGSSGSVHKAIDWESESGELVETGDTIDWPACSSRGPCKNLRVHVKESSSCDKQ